MDLFFFKGILAGLILGIPAGPIGAIAIRRLITKGPIHGVFMGLGCALVDVIYGIFIGLGSNYVSSLLFANQFWISFFGGIILIGMGIKIFFTPPSFDSNSAYSGKDYLSSSFMAFFLALTSPAILISFTAVFASLNLGFSTVISIMALKQITGIVIGGAIWWVILGFSVRLLKRKINTRSLKNINKFFGLLLIIIAVLLNINNGVLVFIRSEYFSP